jgi:hypothetical protein
MRALAVAVLIAGCGSDLPSASFIDKLRVLAVRAEPPEVAPGAPTRLGRLAVEPPVPSATDDAGALAPLSTLWLACGLPSGVSVPLPCGVGPDAPGFQVIGSDAEVSYTPDGSSLGSDGTGEVLLTVVVADTPGGAAGCLAGVGQSGLPAEPDRCVIALKRLTVSDPARVLAPPNANPSLTSFTVEDSGGAPEPLADASMSYASASYAVAGKAMTLATTRADGAAEIKPDGTYEALSISWFSDGGKIDGGRSALDPPGCSSQADCAKKPPVSGASTSWDPPGAKPQPTAAPDGTVRFWAVVRDDRGGVNWLSGSAHPR